MKYYVGTSKTYNDAVKQARISHFQKLINLFSTIDLEVKSMTSDRVFYLNRF